MLRTVIYLILVLHAARKFYVIRFFILFSSGKFVIVSERVKKFVKVTNFGRLTKMMVHKNIA